MEKQARAYAYAWRSTADGRTVATHQARVTIRWGGLLARHPLWIGEIARKVGTHPNIAAQEFMDRILDRECSAGWRETCAGNLPTATVRWGIMPGAHSFSPLTPTP